MTRRADNLANPHDTTADLFGGLHVSTPDGDLPASRVDIGWSAWRSALTTEASRWQRWHFWLALWRHFGQARYLVQIDNQYRLATSLRISRRSGSGLDILLVQSAGPWQGLWQRLWRRKDSPERKHLSGHRVRVSRYPAELAGADLPVTTSQATAGKPCPEALLDRLRRCGLPLEISDH